MVIRQQVARLQVFMDRIHRVNVRVGGVDGMHVGNEMGRIVITSFGEVDFVAHPVASPFVTVTGFDVKRGLDQPGGGWHLLSLTLTQLIINQDILLHPDLAQAFNRG